MRKHPAKSIPIDELAAALTQVRTQADMRLFLEEVLTPGERHDLTLRWQLLRMLTEGISQRTIAKELGISLCKITRGSRELRKEKSIARDLLARSVKSKKNS